MTDACPHVPPEIKVLAKKAEERKEASICRLLMRLTHSGLRDTVGKSQVFKTEEDRRHVLEGRL